MPRPNVDTETRDRLAEVVDRNADVPAEILTFDEQLAYVLRLAEDHEAELSRLQENTGPLR